MPPHARRRDRTEPTGQIAGHERRAVVVHAVRATGIPTARVGGARRRVAFPATAGLAAAARRAESSERLGLTLILRSRKLHPGGVRLPVATLGWPVRDAPPEEGPALDPPPTHRFARSHRPHVPGPATGLNEKPGDTGSRRANSPDPHVPVARRDPSEEISSQPPVPSRQADIGGWFFPAAGARRERREVSGREVSESPLSALPLVSPLVS